MSWLIGPGIALALAAAAALHPAGRRPLGAALRPVRSALRLVRSWLRPVGSLFRPVGAALRPLGFALLRASRAIGRWHGRRGSVTRADLLASTFGIWADPITVGRAYERLDVGQLLVEGSDPVAVLAARFSCGEARIVSLLSEYLGTPSVR